MKANISKKIFWTLLCIAILLILPSAVKAAYISVTPSTKNAQPGQSVNIKVSSDCTGKVRLSASNGTLSKEIDWVEAGGSTSANVVVGSSGTTTISARAVDMSDSNGSAVTPPPGSTSISIAASNNSNSTNSTSSVATLANLGIRPNDFSGFKATKTSYSTDVPNNVESVEIYATKGQSGQSISGTGKKALKEGSNTFNIVVTAEDGKTKKTYTLTINRKSNTDTENTVTNTTSNDTVNETANNTEENEFENEIIDDTNEVNNSINNIAENNNENKNALSLQTKNIIIIAAIAIIIIIIIIIIAVEKNKKDNEYYDLLDDNKNNNEDKDFDTSSMPVALQNKEDNNSKNNDDNDATDDYSPKVKDEELEPNNKDKNSKLEEMFEDVENEKLKHKPHYKGRRFK